jgi:Zn-dependent protease
MLNTRELAYIITISIILAFTISLVETLELFLFTLFFVFLVIIINVLAKKITAFILDSEIEIKLWEVKRWGYRAHHHLKKTFPAGAFLPLLVTGLSFGFLYWMSCLVFETKGKVYRAAKRWGLYSFSEITEYHIALIAGFGILANLVFAIIGYIIGMPEFARLNIYFAFFNILPISDLDGSKILFGSIVFWSFLAILTLIALGYALFLI